jgi:hypothetical protein
MIGNDKDIESKGSWKIAAALSVSLMCFAAVNVSAQVSKSIGPEGAVSSRTAPKASIVIPEAHPVPEEPLAAGVSLIYSNLGTGTSVYNAGSGWTEAGVEANDEAIAEAMQFTPDSTYLLLRIDAAFTYVQGTNGAKLILAEDNGGVPGKIIYAASFTNLPTFGTCCTLQTAKLQPTKTSYVALNAGQTYWIYPLPDDTTGYLVWNFDTTNKGGTGAVSHDYGKTWTAAALSPFGAFDLYGIKLGQ